MTVRVVVRKGNNAINSSYTGEVAELTYDTDNNTIRIHNGVAAGGVSAVTTATAAGLTVNNANYLGGTAAASYQLNSTLAANVAQLAANTSLVANNANNLGGVSLATIQSQITGNASSAAATAYSNAVANSAALYQTTAGLSANVAGLTANNSTNLGGVAAASYQLNSTLAANVAGLTANNATNLGGVAASNYTTTGKAIAMAIVFGG